ncbi:MAG TPA: hypothetical protein VJP04_00250 [Terriglobales bacterium]|nr:hypothetical protein [Terriglobales bacterium]
MRRRRKEAGIALLISIFILLLIGVIAIALVVSSGTESALAGNYRSSSNVYYAAFAGVEEVRARLRSNNPNSFNNTSPGLLPPPGTALAPCAPVYVTNPLGGEAVAPWDPANAYYDAEFGKEFAATCPAPLPPNPSPSTASVWNRPPLNGLAFPGPPYKWVRINAISEQSLGLDVDADGRADSATPLYFDSTNRVFSNNSVVGFQQLPQALELTAFAVLPNGSQKLLQYLVASAPINLPPFPSAGTPFPAALILAGSSSSSVVAYSAPASNAGFGIKGIDQDCSGSLTGTKLPAIGVFNNNDKTAVVSGGNGGTGIPAGYQSNYPGSSATLPDVELVSLPGTLNTPSGLDAIVQLIIQNADATIPSGSGPTQTSFLSSLLSSGKMSSTSPMTLVVNGDLDLTGWHYTGYGLLLVTGNLNYDPDATWDGIVMVVGQGTVTGSQGGAGGFNGAILVARTHDASGALLSGSSFGNSSVNFNNGSSMGGFGVRYSSCWIQRSQPPSGYKILSFREISQ